MKKSEAGLQKTIRKLDTRNIYFLMIVVSSGFCLPSLNHFQWFAKEF